MTTRILIAGDNQDGRARLTELIQSHEYWDVCGRAESGEKAVLKAKELKPDIIILDLKMPVMNGLGAAREIRKVLPELPSFYTLAKNFPRNRKPRPPEF
jgi:CheY-like chemotaxis protein